VAARLYLEWNEGEGLKGLKRLLDAGKCFKLVCGAGNDDAAQVERLVSIYSQAGCKFFDLSANKEVVAAAKRAIAGREGYLCVSIGVKGDPHGGSVDLPKILPPLIKMGLDCIELHASIEDEIEVMKQWRWLNENFDGFLSLCVSRGKLSDTALFKRVRKACACRNVPYTIIQADGFPMSGGEDDFKTTLQAVATAEIVQNADLPAYLLLSGGTNSKTAELARQCGINYHGIAIGSYARKIIGSYPVYPACPDEKSAVEAAKQLVHSVCAL
jgi:hypothetical protein